MSAKADNSRSWAREADEEEDELTQRGLKKMREWQRGPAQEERRSMQEVPERSGSEDFGREAEGLVADLAMKALIRRGSKERFGTVGSGYSFADFECPAFVNVRGKKASIPFALTTNRAWIVGRLKETMDGMPSSAEITFKYTFEKTTEGKLKDVKGNVKVTVNW
jgi:hypothetical protein